MNNKNVQVILLAAGKSSRLGSELSKPWLNLGEKQMIAHSLDIFAANENIKSGVIVASKDTIDEANKIASQFKWKSVTGGSERAFSVKEGLKAISIDKPDYVIIHDAARPFVITEIIDSLIFELDNGADGAIPVIPVTDSLATIDNETLVNSISRDGVWRVQTPQAFKYDILKMCHDSDKIGNATDDSSLVKLSGGVIKAVRGDILMDKITTPDDLSKARLLEAGMIKKENIPNQNFETRMSTGYDVHKFSTNSGPLILGGILIPYEFSFEAHSDGDVALHSLTDAIFGLIADGDIGSHFPPTDETWKNSNSAFFLRKANEALNEQSGHLTFVDLTIIAEEPKIGPYRDEIRSSIAKILEIDVSRVSIKATTSEGLGFIGKKEGIAVQAAATAQFSKLD